MDSLGTRTAIRLLNVLFSDPLHSFKEIELIKRAKTGKGSASMVVRTLVKEKIVQEKRVGKTRVIMLNLKNPRTFFLKNIFDYEKLKHVPNNKQAAILLLKNEVKDKIDLLLVFGSSVAGTSNKKSDIDIIVVSDTLAIVEERKKVEDVFGERFNIHHFTKEEIKKTIKNDLFVQHALLTGILLTGYDLGFELYQSLSGGEKMEKLQRLYFFHERMKAALRNYHQEDYKTAKDILEKLWEQIIFYMVSEKEIYYESKKDALQVVLRLPDGKVIHKILKSPLKKRLVMSETFVLNLFKQQMFEEEGYGN